MTSDGILGLSPKFMSSASSGGELLLTSLAKSGAIRNAIFGLYITYSNKQSKMHIGGWDDNYIKAAYPKGVDLTGKYAADLICWMDVNSNNYWQVSFQYVLVNGASYNFTPSVSNFVFDSGSSLSYIPASDYTKLYGAITNNTSASCRVDASSGLTYCTCTSSSDPRYPNISFKLGDRYMIYMNNSDYLLYDSSRRQCILTFI